MDAPQTAGFKIYYYRPYQKMISRAAKSDGRDGVGPNGGDALQIIKTDGWLGWLHPRD